MNSNQIEYNLPNPVNLKNMRKNLTLKKQLSHQLIRYNSHNHLLYKQSNNHLLHNQSNKQNIKHNINLNPSIYSRQTTIRKNNPIDILQSKDLTQLEYQLPIQQLPPQLCANHPQRLSQYIVNIDNQTLNYCRKCAAHIASQGFDVHKIPTSPIQQLNSPINFLKTQRLNKIIPNKQLLTQSQNMESNILSHKIYHNKFQREILLPNISPSRNKRCSLPNNMKIKSNLHNVPLLVSKPLIMNQSQYIRKQKERDLKNLIESLEDLKIQYKQKQEQLNKICWSFGEQKQTLINYYDQLISHILQIKTSHLQAIQQSSINVIQLCQIQKGEIQQTIGQIDQMVNDIQSNMENILEKVDEKDYNQCYQFYKQKQSFFNHRLEEIGTEAKPWPLTSEQEINDKIYQFKTFVNQLHQVTDQTINLSQSLLY